jgi:hypothetical protein
MHRLHFCLLLLLTLLASPWPLPADSYVHIIRLEVKHRVLEEQLSKNDFGVPIVIQANGDDGRMEGNVYGILEQPFSAVRQALVEAPNWCKITPLHFNIKACTWQKINGDYRLTLYSGRKYYEEPGSTYVFDYRYHSQCDDSSYCEVTLSSEDGPMDTGNYRFQAEIIPLNGKTFIHFHYGYEYGFVTDMAMFTYLSTIGSGKVGFTITGHGRDGEPEYIGGVQGVVERNAMRYYLALQAYLDSLKVPEKVQFDQRLQRWYDLTDRYRHQLYEMSREDYLTYKQHEHNDQKRLQQEISGNRITGKADSG